jgi:hypothetical protein
MRIQMPSALEGLRPSGRTIGEGRLSVTGKLTGVRADTLVMDDLVAQTSTSDMLASTMLAAFRREVDSAVAGLLGLPPALKTQERPPFSLGDGGKALMQFWDVTARLVPINGHYLRITDGT